jgi:hypothetical protein
MPASDPNHLTEAPALEIYWCLVGPSGKTLTAAVFTTADGLQLRCSYTMSDTLLAQNVESCESAALQAAQWRTAFVAKGFVELSLPH